MEIRALSRDQIESQPLPGPSAVISMADTPDDLAVIKDTANVVARLNLIFNDATEAYHLVRPPSADDARKILQFVREQSHVPFLVAQCQVGVGRSQAVMAALARIHGGDPKPVLHGGTYNRRLYRILLAEAGVAVEPEPLVSLAVRVKYAPDRLRLFLLSMQRQRHENWEVVAVTDGPNPAAVQMVADLRDPRIRMIETEQALGRWGHPYRQRGLEACRGEFIGMNNDDNYCVPGYLEQLLHALADADLAVCSYVHSYLAWTPTQPGTGIGAWLARAWLVRQVPWTGLEFNSDREYVQQLADAAGPRTVVVPRPLFVHN